MKIDVEQLDNLIKTYVDSAIPLDPKATYMVVVDLPFEQYLSVCKQLVKTYDELGIKITCAPKQIIDAVYKIKGE